MTSVMARAHVQNNVITRQVSRPARMSAEVEWINSTMGFGILFSLRLRQHRYVNGAGSERVERSQVHRQAVAGEKEIRCAARGQQLDRAFNGKDVFVAAINELRPGRPDEPVGDGAFVTGDDRRLRGMALRFRAEGDCDGGSDCGHGHYHGDFPFSKGGYRGAM